jgi:hypothetical protein
MLAEPEDLESGFPQAHGQPGEVAIARDEAEAVKALGVQEVHRVDDQRAVRRVLARGVRELLDWLDSVALQHLLPGGAGRRREIAVDALHGRLAEASDLGQQTVDHGGLRVVGIDEDGKAKGRFLGFDSCYQLGGDHGVP